MESIANHPWLHQVLLRPTQRPYADRPVPESLVLLLLTAAFSVSSNSAFQQASFVWPKNIRRPRRGPS